MLLDPRSVNQDNGHQTIRSDVGCYEIVALQPFVEMLDMKMPAATTEKNLMMLMT
jgi:hypothetical protein